jgi:hypothetical protein
VAVFAMENERPEERPVATTRSDEEGRYRLRVGTEGPYLVAAVDAEEHRPAFAKGASALGRDILMPDLVLSEGMAVSGTIRVAGKPAAAAGVSASHHGPVRGHRLRMHDNLSTELVFLENSMERATAAARADATGHYRIRGLGRVAYRVQPSYVPGLCSEVMNAFRRRRTVVPPEADVNFDFVAVPVTIEVRSNGKPVAGATVGILARRQNGSPSSCMMPSTNEDGLLRVALAPEADYDLRVSARGCRAEQTRLTTGRAGLPRSRVIHLVPRAEPGAIRLTVVTSDGALPAELFLHLERPDDPAETAKRRVAGNEGAFLVDDLEPGLYRITVGHALSGGASYYLKTTGEARVLSGKTAGLTLRLELGGRIRIAVRDREGRFVEQPCRVVDQYGLLVKRWFRLVYRAGNWMAATAATSKDGPVESFPPLPPGPYRIEFLAEGNRVEHAIAVQVTAGKTADACWTR